MPAVSNNLIGDRGAFFLAQALATNDTLQSLQLSWNRIGGNGAQDLAVALSRNYSLEQLILYSNRFGDRGAAVLLEAVISNRGSRIARIDVGDNGVRNGLQERLKNFLVLRKQDVMAADQKGCTSPWPTYLELLQRHE